MMEKPDCRRLSVVSRVHRVDKIRTLRIDEIKLPVIVEHAEMDIGDDGRIDRRESRHN